MSTGFNILLSPPLEDSDQPIEVYKKLLTVIHESPNISSDSSWVKIYRGQRPFDRGSDAIDLTLHSTAYQRNHHSSERLRNIRQRPIEGHICWRFPRLTRGVNGAMRFAILNPRGARSPLNMRRQLLVRGIEIGSLVPIMSISTTSNSFRRRIDLSKCPADSPAALVKMGQYGKNVLLVENLFKRIAAAIKPQHQLLITEGNRVNPLLFHMIYHSALSGTL